GQIYFLFWTTCCKYLQKYFPCTVEAISTALLSYHFVIASSVFFLTTETVFPLPCFFMALSSGSLHALGTRLDIIVPVAGKPLSCNASMRLMVVKYRSKKRGLPFRIDSAMRRTETTFTHSRVFTETNISAPPFSKITSYTQHRFQKSFCLHEPA